MKKLIHQNTAMPLQTYIPRRITNAAMLVYIAALVLCLILYQRYALQWRWMAFGIIEVVGFFFMSNQCSKSWINIHPRNFVTNIFWWAFALRVLWVIISYLLHMHWTGTAFSINAADELLYDEMGHYGASVLREGHWNLFTLLMSYGGDMTLSDMGYPIYLSIIYFIFGDSIIVARIIKAALGAWTAVLVYKLAGRNFGEHTGRMAAIMCMLMPTLIYYCSMQLKEVEMVFFTILFAERADQLLRRDRIPWKNLLALMMIPVVMFTFRTALAATLVLAFMCALVLSSERVVSAGRRISLTILAIVLLIVMIATNTNIVSDVSDMWETRGKGQRANMEWRAEREDMAGGLNQKYAKYAGAAVFAPLIFTLPFPTMAETPGQENQKMIHGGNYVKNIISYFTIAAVLILLLTGDWRKHVMPLALLCGYLLILVFSSFAHSERFHQPIIPLTLMMAAYGISQMHRVKHVKKWYQWWCVLMLVAAIAWNWFKLAGRGLI